MNVILSILCAVFTIWYILGNEVEIHKMFTLLMAARNKTFQLIEHNF